MKTIYLFFLGAFIALAIITVVAGLISMRCKETDHERPNHSAADYRFYQRDLLQPFQRRVKRMVASNLPTPPPPQHLALIRGLSPEQLHDIAHWLGMPHYLIFGTGTYEDGRTRPQILALLRDLL